MELMEELRRLHSDCLETDRPPSTVPSSVVVVASDPDDDQKPNMSKTIEELHGKQLSLERDNDDEEEAQYLLGNSWLHLNFKKLRLVLNIQIQEAAIPKTSGRTMVWRCLWIPSV